MSEIARGVMGMPYEMAMCSWLSRRQFYEIARGVYAESERLRAENESLRADAHLHKLSMDAACYDIQAMREDLRIMDILAEAMAEVKAASDGESDQPIADIVSGCLAEIAAISSPENPS